MHESCLESFNTNMESGEDGGVFSWMLRLDPPKAIQGGEHCEMMDHTLIYFGTK